MSSKQKGGIMPKAQKKPEPPPQPPAAVVNGPTTDVLTLAEMATYLRLPEANVIAAVNTQGLPGRQLGTEWRFLKSAVQQWLSRGAPTLESRKAAQMALAGKYKDDP